MKQTPLPSVRPTADQALDPHLSRDSGPAPTAAGKHAVVIRKPLATIGVTRFADLMRHTLSPYADRKKPLDDSAMENMRASLQDIMDHADHVHGMLPETAHGALADLRAHAEHMQTLANEDDQARAAAKKAGKTHKPRLKEKHFRRLARRAARVQPHLESAREDAKGLF